MPTLTIRSSPSHGPETPYGRLLTTRSQSDILVPKPVKANIEFASPIKAQNIFLSPHDVSKPLTRSTSALAFDNYPLPQTPVRSTSAHNFVNGPVGDDLSSSPERLAGIEIQNILFQRALTEHSTFTTPKSPAPAMFKLVPTTPTVKRNLSSMFETCKEESSTPSAEDVDEDEVRPTLDRTVSPSMIISRDSTSSFYNMVDTDEDDEEEEDVYSSGDDEDDDEYYQEEPNFKMFGMYGSDDEDQTPSSSDGMYNFRSMTPPVRTENPLCFDDRFQHFSHVPDKKRYDIGVELGLFKFSPIPSQN